MKKQYVETTIRINMGTVQSIEQQSTEQSTEQST